MGSEYSPDGLDEYERLRNRVGRVTLTAFAAGTWALTELDLSEKQAFVAKAAMCGGLLLSSVLGLNKIPSINPPYGEEGDNGGGPGNDPRPIIPDSPGSTDMDWIGEVEDFLRSSSAHPD